MDKILDAVGKLIEGITNPERVQALLETVTKFAEIYATIKGLKK